MKISIVSVLYNQELTSGNTWRTLLQPALRERERNRRTETADDPAVQVILSDNSTEPSIREENRRLAGYGGAVYLDMKGNRGLPAAYNRAIDEILHCQETLRKETVRETEKTVKNDEWIVVTDQDTVFPENYVQVLTETAALTDCDVLTPVVKAGEKQLSPCGRRGARFVPCDAETAASEYRLRAAGQDVLYINTGLAFRASLFEDAAIRYEEQLFLDFADFDLIHRVRSQTQARFGQLPGIVLQQSFSGTEERTAEQDMERFRHFVHDGRLFYERWYGQGSAESAIRRRALRLAVKHRDRRFLKKD